MRALLLSTLALFCLLFPAPARALVGDSDGAFGLDGSIRNISGAIDNFNPSPFWLPTNGGDAFSQTILRLTAMGAPTRWLSYELHAVQTLDYSSGGASSGAFSLVPGVTRFRALDATWTPDSSGKLTATTLLDRFAVKFSPEWGDITIGRQAITFGKAFFWNPLDVFLAFDPLQFDREYKPGVDALRVDIPLGDFSGITLVGALGREITPTGSYLTGNKAFDADWYGSAALARFFTLYENFDLSLQAGKIYGGYQVGGGASGEVMEWLELRIEAACFRAMDSLGIYASPLHLPASYLGPLVEDHATAVLGIGHRFESTLHVQMEYLFNGQGEPDRLSLGLVRVSHGQSYHMGRHVLGVTASYEVLPIVTGQLAAIASLDARSAQIQPSVTWSASDNIEVIGGAIVSLGERPVGTSPLVPGLQSEFGTFPDFYFLEVKAYF